MRTVTKLRRLSNILNLWISYGTEVQLVSGKQTSIKVSKTFPMDYAAMESNYRVPKFWLDPIKCEQSPETFPMQSLWKEASS